MLFLPENGYCGDLDWLNLRRDRPFAIATRLTCPGLLPKLLSRQLALPSSAMLLAGAENAGKPAVSRRACV